jgi:hypothetical protein
MKDKEKKGKGRRSTEAAFNFPFGEFKNISEMMNKCCGGKEVAFDCCSMMEGIMKGKGHKTEPENKNK